MSDIIQFPKKSFFLKMLDADYPEDFSKCVSNEYDKALDLFKNAPNPDSIVYHPADLEKMQKFKNEHQAFLLKLFYELMVEKVDKCCVIHNYGIGK